MTALITWLRRLRALVSTSQRRLELEEEIRLHLALRRERLERDGLRAADAAAAARRRFGNQLRIREEGMAAWGWLWLEQITQDVRFGARTLVKSPGFTATVVLTLALATGATTAIFSIVNGVLLRPLPFAQPDRLVQVYGRSWRGDLGLNTPDPLEGPVAAIDLAEFEKQNTTFTGFTAYGLGTKHLVSAGEPERLMAVTADLRFFSVLGVSPLIGRTFGADDGADVAVISERLWERRFNRDVSLPGKKVSLDGRPFTIVGVMPDAFQFPYKAASLMPGALPESRTDVWVPVGPFQSSSLRGPRFSVTGRLKPGVSVEAAAAELRSVASRVEHALYQGTGIRVGVRLVPLAQEVLEPVRRSLWLLFAAVGLVLIATWTNVANLLLARLTVRANEVMTRAAVGAGRLRLARQFIAESLMLSLTAGLLGLLVAKWGIDLLVAIGSARIPRAHEVTIDWQSLLFLVAVSVAAALVFGVVPALWAARGSLQAHSDDARMTAGYGRVRDALVVIEVALAAVLAFGAALMIGEMSRLRHVPSGVVTDNVLTAHLTPRTSADDYYAIEARVAQQPGVRAAGFTQLVPLQNWGWEADFSVGGRPREGRPIAGLRYVTPGYFSAMGIPVRRGRAFTEHDNGGSLRVIVVNEALARLYFAGEDPIGRDLDRGRIVGVVGDVRQSGVDRPATPEIFYPAAQNVTMASDIGMALIVRTDGPPEALVGAVRASVRAVNPSLAVFNVKTMSQVLGDSLWEVNLYRWIIGLFALLVVVLAAIGLYGVMTYTVTARRKEFAIRLALGARPSSLVQVVMGRGLRLAAIGLVVGVIVSANLTLALNALPVGGSPNPATFTAVGALLIAVALVSCAIPAMRITAVDPVRALRQE